MLEPEVYKSNAPCVVFKGRAENIESLYVYLKKLLQYSLESIVLMNAAAHPQHTGEILEQYETEPYKDILKESALDTSLHNQIKEMDAELKHYRKRALTEGCARENKSLFYIEHIFCDVICNAPVQSHSPAAALSFLSSSN